MKIALIGYGKMGKEIEKIAIDRNHEIVLKIDLDTQNEFTIENLKKADVVIEFTRPETAFANYSKCFDAKIPVVSGTTGWLNQWAELETRVINENLTFFYASNFSVGVNVFFKLNEYLAKMMNTLNQYSVSMEEVHHTQKLDAPSGTAVSLAEGIIKNLDRIEKWKLTNADTENEMPITAKREGQVPGIHTVTYDSEVDFITMTHSAKSRKGFALGAVLAAEYASQNRGILSMSDLLKL